MPVTFVIGRAGSGKTWRCRSAIVEALRAAPIGPPIYWLVPKQATFMTERALACDSGLPGFCRARAVSFERLGEEIFAECGGAAIPQVTESGRRMILGHLLRQNAPKLKYFASSARQPGLAAELDRTFAEFERAGKTPADLANLIEELSNSSDVDGQSLRAKLRDLHLLYQAYGEFLGQERLDQHRRQEQILSLIDQCGLFKAASVYVDGFIDLTDFQRRLLAAIAKASARMEIALLMNPQCPAISNPHALPLETALFHRTENTYRRLWFTFHEAGVAIAEPILLYDAPRFETSALANLEKRFLVKQETPGSTPKKSSRRGAEAQRIEDDLCASAPLREPFSSDRADCIERITAPDREAEVDAVSREIRLLLAQGYRLRDIVVLARNLEPYRSLIAAAFDEHEIPYFVDQRRSAAHHPLLEFLRSALRIARFDWHGDSVMSMLKTGLAGVSSDQVDELENYVLLHRVRGEAWESPQAWTYHRKLTLGEEPAAAGISPANRIDSIRRDVAGKLAPVVALLRDDRAITVREMAVQIFDLFERFNVREKLSEWIGQGEAKRRTGHGNTDLGGQSCYMVGQTFLSAIESASGGIPATRVDSNPFGRTGMSSAHGFDGRQECLPHQDKSAGPLSLKNPSTVRADELLDESRQHEQVWAELVGLFEEMVELLGEHSLRGDEFVEVLESALEHFDLAIAPPTVDQVLVGQVDRTICPSVRAAFVLGLNEREFPAVPRDETVFSDRERGELGRRKLELDPDSRRRILDEPLLGYIAMTRASERLIMTRARADQRGRQTAPSPFWNDIERTFPDVRTTNLPDRSNDDVEQLSTPRQLVSGVMRWVRRAATHNETRNSWAALYQWLATRTTSKDSVHHVRQVAWPALSYANTAHLSSATTTFLFPSPLSATVSQIETFAACPFRHFARYGLRLSTRRDQDVTIADLSQVYHRALEQLFNLVAQAEQRWDDDPLPITEQMIHSAVETVGRTLRGEFMLSSARNRYLLHRAERTLRQLIASQRELMKHSRFRPLKAGASFSEQSPIPPLEVKTPKGMKVALEGKIDRVDLHSDGEQFVAYDYRLLVGPLSLQKAQYGLTLGLLAHLLVVQAHGEKLAGQALKPAAAFYLQLLRSLGDVDHPDEALGPDDPRYLLAIKPRGIFDSRCLGDLDTDLAEGRSMSLAAHINKKGGFGYRNSTDVAEAGEFSGILNSVRERIGIVADEILGGRIDIAPFKLNTETPCPRCEFRGVCRFEPGINHYTMLTSMGREQVLEKVVAQASSL